MSDEEVVAIAALVKSGAIPPSPPAPAKTPEEKKRERKAFWIAFVVGLAISLGLFGVFSTQTVQDWMAGVSYAPDERTASLETALELTGKGKRIWAATWPVLENAENFNAHCDSHDEDVTVLGCYSPSDDKIYIYEIKKEELADAMRTTAAHELLHATWTRMSEGTQNDLRPLLEQVYEENREWFDEELSSYEDADRLEEIYTRAGTKLNSLPEALEIHYAEIFGNRLAVVKYYENYQAVFDQIKQEMDALDKKMTQMDRQIEAQRITYRARSENYNLKVERFNNCASTPGCFTQSSFDYQSALLTAEEAELENLRTNLNELIDEYNAMVDQYQEYQETQSGLYAEMNSNTKIEIEE